MIGRVVVQGLFLGFLQNAGIPVSPGTLGFCGSMWGFKFPSKDYSLWARFLHGFQGSPS